MQCIPERPGLLPRQLDIPGLIALTCMRLPKWLLSHGPRSMATAALQATAASCHASRPTAASVTPP